MKKQKVIVRKCNLPKKLNDRGCKLLCQAVIANAIRSRDTEWMNSDASDLYRTIGFGRTGYNIDKVFKNYNENSKPLEVLNPEQIREEAKEFTLSQLSIKYGRTYSAMRKFCVKNHITYLKIYDYKKEK